jgi:hypothetical protein
MPSLLIEHTANDGGHDESTRLRADGGVILQDIRNTSVET